MEQLTNHARWRRRLLSLVLGLVVHYSDVQQLLPALYYVQHRKLTQYLRATFLRSAPLPTLRLFNSFYVYNGKQSSGCYTAIHQGHLDSVNRALNTLFLLTATSLYAVNALMFYEY